MSGEAGGRRQPNRQITRHRQTQVQVASCSRWRQQNRGVLVVIVGGGRS